VVKARVGLAQINPTVGDLEGNKRKILRFIDEARRKNVDMVVFPELAITGYPPKDLLFRKRFVEKNRLVLDEIIGYSSEITVVVGFVDVGEAVEPVNRYDPSAFPGLPKLFNAAAVVDDKELVGVQHKKYLPSYDVFDEKRYFTPAETCEVFRVGDTRLGVTICEDIWVDHGPVESLARKGAELIVNISASPFYVGKTGVRARIVSKRAKENNVPLVYVNMVGGQDDLVFDGRSLVSNPFGELVAVGGLCEEELVVVDPWTRKKVTLPENILEEVFKVLTLGIRDYVHKNGFERVVIGISGGIDSALTAVLAVEALGSENVVGVSMPSHFTPRTSLEDAEKLAKNLGIKLKKISIKKIFESYMEVLSQEFAGTGFGVTEENIQARIRGNILMALSNKFGYLVVSTGNKSEMAVGYTTLYGDMAGGLAAISDVPKTMVYKLVEYINQKKGGIVPETIIKKEPSAELREGQKDTDTLPPYSILDPILHEYIENNLEEEEIISKGYNPDTVKKVVRMVDRNEYKRKQAPIGIKITPKAFGFGRRMPITNRYTPNSP